MDQLIYPPVLQSEHVKGARLFANRSDAIASLDTVERVAEIGVAFGDFSRELLDQFKPDLFDAYDLFELHDLEMIWGKKSSETFQGKTHLEFYEDRYADLIERGKLRTFEGDSAKRMAEVPDEFYDVIYVDGDHYYDGVLRDAEIACAKIRKDGRLIFNDYIMSDPTANVPYGIVPVVNDLCVSGGWRIEYLALQSMMFCDVCLVRRKD